METAAREHHPEGGGVMDNPHYETVLVPTTVSSADFEPDEESKLSLREQVLELLRERRGRGLTRLNVPEALSLSLAARIYELRKAGFRIATFREPHGNASIGRYVLLGGPDGDDVGA